MSDVDKFLKNMGGETKADKWSEVIAPASSYLIVGDVGTGKTALAFYLLERFSKELDLKPVVVGFPKHGLLPQGFEICPSPEELANIENAICFIDEADIQLPIEDTKARKYVTNFLALPRQRNQVFLLSYHFPRLVLGRYLPFFSGFLLKRPPYLIEFAGKRQGDQLTLMMNKAEERFAELPKVDDVVKNTYIIAPRIRWQGMLENPLCSFWNDSISKIWAGTEVEKPKVSDQLKMAIEQGEIKELAKLKRIFPAGIPFDKLIEYDKRFTIDELKKQCRQAGIPVSGDKKVLCAKLIARESENERNKV